MRWPSSQSIFHARRLGLPTMLSFTRPRHSSSSARAGSQKTHSGVQSQFHKLTKDESAIDPGLAGDLSAAYHFKQAADYETGPAAMITQEDAGEAIRAAGQFVAAVKRALSA